MDRREFLKELGMIGGSTLLMGLYPWLQSCSPQAKSEIAGEKARIAIVGTGSRGMYHINNMKGMANAEIVALCDNYAPHLNQAAALCPDAKCYDSFDALLEDKNVQGLLICTPLYLHAPMTINGMRAGKHVFCEKAMAHTLEACREMYDVWKQTGRVMYIGQQRLYDMKYIKAMEMIHNGTLGDVVGIRNFWYRNNDWRRPVPSPELERHINWRLYREYSCGLMTELGCHHLQDGTWALRSLPDYVMGSGDIVYWKDGREVYDNISVIYHYPNGVKMTFDSVISNKHYGMDEQILGSKGTLELSQGRFYREDPPAASGIRQMINQIEQGVFSNSVFAGTTWVPETASKDRGVLITDHVVTHDGSNTTGADGDGSIEIVEAFCHSVITGRQAENLVEEAYYAGVLSLLGLQAMEEHRIVTFPEEYKIPYANLVVPPGASL